MEPDLSDSPPSQGYAKAVYILYLVGLVIGISALVGVIIAYIKKGECNTPAWLESHYRFQIQTFWFGLIYWVAGVLLTLIMVGWVLLLWWAIWVIIRCVKGLTAIDSQTTIEGRFFSLGLLTLPKKNGA